VRHPAAPENDDAAPVDVVVSTGTAWSVGRPRISVKIDEGEVPAAA